MKNGMRMLCLLAVAVLLSALMTTAVLADESPCVWLSVTQKDGQVTALIVTNTTVTDGQIKLTYDSNALTYEGLTVNEACVYKHAVNANNAGVLPIAWVDNDGYTVDGSGLHLMEVTFLGTDASSLELSGVIQDAQGNKISLTEVDTGALSAAIAAAKALDPDAYTAESWADVRAAWDNANTVLADPTATQSEADAAAAALQAAIAALEKAPALPPVDKPDDGEDSGNNSDTGDDTPLGPIIAVMALCLLGIVVVIVILLRKGRKK